MSRLVFPADTNHAKTLSRLAKAGKVRKLFHGVYTEELATPVELVVAENWMQLLTHLVPGAILSFRTALELAPALNEEGRMTIFATSSYSKEIIRGPLTIKITRGNTVNYTEAVSPSLRRSNLSRALLENLSNTRKRKGLKKSLERAEIEEHLTNILKSKGEKELNRIRDEGKEIAAFLGIKEASSRLNSIISSLLSSNIGVSVLQTEYAKAQASQKPYDLERIKLLQALSDYLQKSKFRERKYDYKKSSWETLSFFESYFSNYIEGTKFQIDEAEEIVFEGTHIPNRHADSHDIRTLFELTSDLSEISKTPESFNELLFLLKSRHARLMRERKNKQPGTFKEKPNQAGNTVFVSPEEVLGTLKQGFEIYQTLTPGIERALFIMFLVTEVHPFDDGNGRVARLMMNAELVRVDNFKIILPTVHRDNYLGGLRKGSRDKEFYLFSKVMDQAQAYTESVPWLHYGEAREKLEKDFAHKDPDEGLPRFNRTLRKLSLSTLLDNYL